MQRCALHVAITQRVFFRAPAGLAHERVVLGYAAIIVDTDDGAIVILGVLRALHFAAITQRDVEQTIAIKHQA